MSLVPVQRERKEREYNVFFPGWYLNWIGNDLGGIAGQK